MLYSADHVKHPLRAEFQESDFKLRVAIDDAVAYVRRCFDQRYGAFEYDDMNTARQDAYSLANFRAGARGRYLFAEVWIRNALNTEYVPVAFAYGQLAPSGFIGEMGRPRTFGVSAGVTF